MHPTVSERGAITKARRLAALPDLLKQKARTTAELAEHFGVPKRTIQRDLETLRGAEYGIESPERGLYLIPSSPSTLTPIEALAVHAAVRLLYHHAPAYNAHYRAALEKLALMLPDPARSVALSSVENLSERLASSRTLEFAARAWFEGKVLAFEYRSPTGSGEWRLKELEIYMIEISRDNLAPYAIGFERSFHREVRTWKLSRMRHTRLLEDTYTIPPHFDPKRYLATAWGVVGTSGGDTALVTLRFAPEAAHRLREGGYPNLRIERELPDGALEVSIRAGTVDGFPLEILSWVQSWGPRVEVLAPENLRERWLSEARLVAGYTKDA